MRRYAELCEAILDHGDKAAAAELPRRDIHRHDETLLIQTPACQGGAGFAQHPAPQVDDQPALLRHGDEGRGFHDAQFRTGPAQQRFGADDDAAVGAHQRVVDDVQLLALQRAAQATPDFQALQR